MAAFKVLGPILRNRAATSTSTLAWRIETAVSSTVTKALPRLTHSFHHSSIKLDEFEDQAKLEADHAEKLKQEADHEEQIKAELLNVALEEVFTHGWTKCAVSAAAEKLGHPSVVAGLIKGGGAELVIHHMKSSNRELDSWMSDEVSRVSQSGEKVKVGKFVREAIIRRLNMNSKYILADRWTEAIALTANPIHCKDTLQALQELCDDIWYRAGDTSADMNWYTKRISLFAIYTATEVFMVQDKSPEFRETWLFLDRRLADLQTIPSMSQLPGDVAGMVGGLATTLRNMAGIQK